MAEGHGLGMAESRPLTWAPAGQPQRLEGARLREHVAGILDPTAPTTPEAHQQAAIDKAHGEALAENEIRDKLQPSDLGSPAVHSQTLGEALQPHNPEPPTGAA